MELSILYYVMCASASNIIRRCRIWINVLLNSEIFKFIISLTQTSFIISEYYFRYVFDTIIIIIYSKVLTV